MQKTSDNDKTGRRFIKGRKQEALAQIEGWVGGSREEIIKAGAAKVSSQPSKNITEQKMLDSKLYDMSRQRFNCILHCQWQRKLFLEKQKRKTVFMRDLLRNVDVSLMSENPFAKRRLTLKPTGKRFQQLQNQKADTTQPGTRQENLDTTFITQRAGVLSQGDNQQQELRLELELEKGGNTSSGPITNRSRLTVTESGYRGAVMQRIWPMNDSRYTKLSESLSENYPKEIQTRASKKPSINLQVLVGGNK